MTEFTLPPFAVDHDERWLDVPLRGNSRQWAKNTARDIATRTGLKGREERKLTGILQGAGEIAQRAQDASMGLLLFPDIWQPIRGLVRFCPVDLADMDRDEAWRVLHDGLVSGASLTEPAEITEIATKAGTCRRIRLRLVTGDGNGSGVEEHFAYVWILPLCGASGGQQEFAGEPGRGSARLRPEISWRRFIRSRRVVTCRPRRSAAF